MQPSRIKSWGRRLATGVTAAVATVALTAVPAHASTDSLSDTASYGWASAVITWPASSFEVSYHLTVNDSVGGSDAWCAEGWVKFYGYSGNQLSGVGGVGDCLGDGIALTQNENVNFYPETVYSVTLELCRLHSFNGGRSCRSKKYAYR